jgi:hypothetical protein
MILRWLVALLRGCSALLAGVLLLLAGVLLFDHSNVLTTFALGVVGFFVFSLLATLWKWQYVLRKLSPPAPAEPVHTPHWISPRRVRARSSALAHESWDGDGGVKSNPLNEMQEESLYSSEYGPDTARMHARPRHRRHRKEG